ncbi:uncharacterized protein LOC141524590 [Cotesia typhae]|uniref:uncharacterized protein LOC141524590 n=1 Tax=Cotesia typhae TaxID=2053667 RepID=UPI003D69C36F
MKMLSLISLCLANGEGRLDGWTEITANNRPVPCHICGCKYTQRGGWTTTPVITPAPTATTGCVIGEYRQSTKTKVTGQGPQVCGQVWEYCSKMTV